MSTGSSSVFSWEGERVLLGVEFHAADGVHYGYLDVWGTRRYAGLNLYGWAYETEPGVPITTSFVPEPSVFLLALGVTGGLLGRRRRPCLMPVACPGTPRQHPGRFRRA